MVICFDVCNPVMDGQQQGINELQTSKLIAEVIQEWGREVGIEFGRDGTNISLSVQQVGCMTLPCLIPEGIALLRDQASFLPPFCVCVCVWILRVIRRA